MKRKLIIILGVLLLFLVVGISELDLNTKEVLNKGYQKSFGYLDNASSQSATSVIVESTILNINTIYPGSYRILNVTGDEIHYNVSFKKDEKTRNTTICLEADFDSKEIDSKLQTKYDVPLNMTFYKEEIINFTKTLVKQPDLLRFKTNPLLGTSPQNPNKFCYEADPDIDFYLKFGEESLIIIQNQIRLGYFDGVVLEEGDSNFSHINISLGPPYNSLVGYWNFDGDAENTKLTTHYDFKGNYDGTGIGDSVVNSTLCMGLGNCIQLDGDADGIQTPFNGTDGNEISFSVWVRRNGTGDRYIIDNSPSTNGYGLRQSTSDVDFFVYSGGNAGAVTSSNVLRINEWVHVVAVHSTINNTIYINGEHAAATNYNASSGIDDSSNFAVIGAAVLGGYVWEGQIDDLMVFSTALNIDQITNIYNNQSSRYINDNNNKNIMRVNGQNVTGLSDYLGGGKNRINITSEYIITPNESITLKVGQINVSINPENLTFFYHFESGTTDGFDNFNGDLLGGEINLSGGLNNTGGFTASGAGGQGINLGDLDISDKFSVLGWVYPVKASDGYIFSKMDSIAGNYTMGLYFHETQQFCMLVSSDGGVVNMDYVCSNTTYDLNKWYLVGGIYNGSDITINVNSVDVSNGSEGTAINGIFEDDTDFIIGGYRSLTTTTAVFNGSLDNLMIFNRTLSSNEILDVYQNDSSIYWTEDQVISSSINTFNISKEADFLILEYNFNSSNYNFTSPILKSNITYDLFSVEEDTCTYSSGDWNIDCGDNCTINSDVDVSGNNLVFTNVGQFTLNATIRNYNQIIISNECKIILNSNSQMW